MPQQHTAKRNPQDSTELLLIRMAVRTATPLARPILQFWQDHTVASQGYGNDGALPP